MALAPPLNPDPRLPLAAGKSRRDLALRGLWGDVICLLDTAATTDFHRHSMQGVFTAPQEHRIVPQFTANGETRLNIAYKTRAYAKAPGTVSLHPTSQLVNVATGTIIDNDDFDFVIGHRV